MAKTYGKTELQKLVDAAYQRGFEDGRNRSDEYSPQPPPIDEIVDHPLDGSDSPIAYKKRPWLENKH